MQKKWKYLSAYFRAERVKIAFLNIRIIVLDNFLTLYRVGDILQKHRSFQKHERVTA